MKSLMTFFFCLLAYINFGQTQMTKFARNNYTIMYPQTWTMDTSKLMGTDMILFSPLENDKDLFKENINILIQDMKGYDMSLIKYKETSEEQLRAMFNDVKFHESTITSSPKGYFLKLVYSITQGQYKLRINTVCYMKNEKAYLVTFTSEEDKYEQFKETGEGILGLFEVK